jgi:hypothetical protein
MRGTAQILAKLGSGSTSAGKDERDERTNETRAGSMFIVE